VAASQQTYWDPVKEHVERLRMWWIKLLGPALERNAQLTWWTKLMRRALGHNPQLTGAMALSVFGGSFDGNSARAVLEEVPGLTADDAFWRRAFWMRCLCLQCGKTRVHRQVRRDSSGLHVNARHAPSNSQEECYRFGTCPTQGGANNAFLLAQKPV
jgi:hypothetical protein